MQAGSTDSPSAPYFPGLTFPPDQRVREKRQSVGEERVLAGEGKIRVKRRGVGGLGGQRGAGEFIGKLEQNALERSAS